MKPILASRLSLENVLGLMLLGLLGLIAFVVKLLFFGLNFSFVYCPCYIFVFYRINYTLGMYGFIVWNVGDDLRFM